MLPNQDIWTTVDELNYVRRLGNHHRERKYSTVEKCHMVMRYIQACHRRDYWEHINKDLVLQEAKRRLRVLRKALEREM